MARPGDETPPGLSDWLKNPSVPDSPKKNDDAAETGKEKGQPAGKAAAPPELGFFQGVTPDPEKSDKRVQPAAGHPSEAAAEARLAQDAGGKSWPTAQVPGGSPAQADAPVAGSPAAPQARARNKEVLGKMQERLDAEGAEYERNQKHVDPKSLPSRDAVEQAVAAIPPLEMVRGNEDFARMLTIARTVAGLASATSQAAGEVAPETHDMLSGAHRAIIKVKTKAAGVTLGEDVIAGQAARSVAEDMNNINQAVAQAVMQRKVDVKREEYESNTKGADLHALPKAATVEEAIITIPLPEIVKSDDHYSKMVVKARTIAALESASSQAAGEPAPETNKVLGDTYKAVLVAKTVDGQAPDEALVTRTAADDMHNINTAVGHVVDDTIAASKGTIARQDFARNYRDRLKNDRANRRMVEGMSRAGRGEGGPTTT